MSKEFVDAYYEDGMYIEVYKDEDGYIIESSEAEEQDYEDIYGPTDVSGEFGGEG